MGPEPSYRNRGKRPFGVVPPSPSWRRFCKVIDKVIHNASGLAVTDTSHLVPPAANRMPIPLAAIPWLTIVRRFAAIRPIRLANIQ